MIALSGRVLLTLLKTQVAGGKGRNKFSGVIVGEIHQSCTHLILPILKITSKLSVDLPVVVTGPEVNDEGTEEEIELYEDLQRDFLRLIHRFVEVENDPPIERGNQFVGWSY